MTEHFRGQVTTKSGSSGDDDSKGGRAIDGDKPKTEQVFTW